jgi:hypothetical protein
MTGLTYNLLSAIQSDQDEVALKLSEEGWILITTINSNFGNKHFRTF